MSQFREIGPAENAFDELEEHRGLGGFTVHDLLRCYLAVRRVAMV